MTNKNLIEALLLPITLIVVASCSPGKGDVRDRNLERATVARLDSVPGVQYFGMSDSHELNDGQFQALIIYYRTDSVGNRIEYNVRVTANNDCSEIYSWEEMDTEVIGDVKQRVNDKFEEKGIGLDGSLIDALIELKKRKI